MKPVALVTGGQQGIGLGVARALVNAGFAIASRSAPDARAVLEALDALGPDCRYYRHDLAEVDRAPVLVDRVEAELGPVTSLVSNAGVPACVRGDMLDITPENFDFVLGVNLRGASFWRWRSPVGWPRGLLSENPQVNVLLLEAGGRDWHPFYHMPAGFAKMTKGIGSWGWQIVPQRRINGMSIRFTQAKVIGGGSAINAQIYTRGNTLDYDEWRQMGCDGGSYEDVLPYFRKAEDNDTFENRYHGKGGPLGVSQPRAPLPICEAFFAAAGELGIPRNEDMTGAKQDGVGYYQLTQRNARRSSAAMAYLAPNRRRPNLTVRTGAQVRRIIVEGERATGIELADGSRLTASTEVILSSGAIGSPRLLMLSGIGPADHLQDVGIRPVLDQPGVGSNLQDHLDLFVICEVSGPHTYDRYARLHWSAVAGLQYLATRRGPAASSLFETGGFWYADKNARSPDIQFHLGVGSGIEAGVSAMPNGGVTLNSAYLRPRSRGTVRLASADPAAAPLIDPNYWEDPHDRAMSIEGLKLAQEIMRQKPLRPFVLAKRLPGPDVRTDQDYFEYACRHAKTDHHPAGTCLMGSDPAAVVDPRLRLNGIDGLRVVDASVMPTVVSSNTNAPTIMIGEKAADMIRADHKL